MIIRHGIDASRRLNTLNNSPASLGRHEGARLCTVPGRPVSSQFPNERPLSVNSRSESVRIFTFGKMISFASRAACGQKRIAQRLARRSCVHVVLNKTDWELKWKAIKNRTNSSRHGFALWPHFHNFRSFCVYPPRGIEGYDFRCRAIHWIVCVALCYCSRSQKCEKLGPSYIADNRYPYAVWISDRHNHWRRPYCELIECMDDGTILIYITD